MVIVIPVVVTVGIIFILVSCGCCLWKKGKPIKGLDKNKNNDGIFYSEKSKKASELPVFDIGIVSTATNNFSEEYLLGEGGFGPVYKGKLMSGQNIAVKRLSKTSAQGLEEFRNEITLIAKLQHRNLVRILGCCTQGEEKMLIYEYMHNRSLDSFIFGKTTGVLLGWQKRYDIITGVARGVLYLHQDSRLRIIHRDLKASNILLDAEMNPKISDFGMARIFGFDQNQAQTNRIAGTIGYMSPEYAMDGKFSTKSDVFSFGVLLLEIISGKKNNTCYNDDPNLNLIRLAWDLWREGKGLELLHRSIRDSCNPSEALRCVQVGLLCVQERANERPSMSSVVFMLENETNMVVPKKPGFYLRSFKENDSNTSDRGPGSINSVTISVIDPR